MKTIIVGLAIILFAANAQASTYREKRELNMKATGIMVLDIYCGAGALVIEGKELQDIKVEAEIEIEGMSEKKAQEFIKDGVELSLVRKGTVAHLTSKINGGTWGSKGARVNLFVNSASTSQPEGGGWLRFNQGKAYGWRCEHQGQLGIH